MLLLWFYTINILFQRFDYSVLTPFLPPKHEYVISIRLHEMQIKAYSHYLEFYARNPGNNKGAQLFSDFNNLQRIWTHPRVLQMNEDRVEKIAEKKVIILQFIFLHNFHNSLPVVTNKLEILV